jgi:ubiquinone biosynthesis protein COQ4
MADDSKKNAVDLKDAMAYMAANVKKIGTSSVVPISSSKYLDHPIIRDVVATWMLRKNGPDFPVEADHTLGIHEALWEVQDQDRVEQLFIEERKKNPLFDAWCGERYFSPLTYEDFKKFPKDSVGGIMNRQIVEFGFQLQLGRKEVGEIKTNYEYWRARNPQIHDFEHIITGGAFDSIGEIIPYFAKLSNMYKYLSPELANELNIAMVFGALRLVSRAGLHYPTIWLTVLECVERGIRVGMNSGPYFLFKYEDILHLTPVEARKVMNVNFVEEFDTAAASVIFREEGPRSTMAAE